MAKTRRRAYPSGSEYTVLREDPKYGRRGNARGKQTKRNAPIPKKQR